MKFANDRLRDLRITKKMHDAPLAQGIGVPYMLYAQWESGDETPPVGMIGKLGKALGVPGSFFLVEDEEI